MSSLYSIHDFIHLHNKQRPKELNMAKIGAYLSQGAILRGCDIHTKQGQLLH